MDALTWSIAGVAGVAVVAAVVAITYVRRLSDAVDDALERIGEAPARRWMRRPAVLRSSVRRLEQATASSERARARLAGAMHAAPIGIVVTDDRGVVMVGNEAAGKYLGARRGEAVAEVRIGEAIEEAVTGRVPVTRELQLYTPVRRVLLLSALPLDHGVESAGAVVYITDVTEERRVEAMRRDFIANVSHELKTPLGALAVLAETLSGGVEDPVVSRRLAGRLEDEARRLSKLLDDILDLSQAEAMSSRFRPVDIGTVVSDAAGHADAGAAERGVEIRMADAPLDAVVFGDERQLRSLVGNLIDNAVKYSDPPPDGPAPAVTVHVATTDDEVIIEVEDQGIGIPESHVSRVFERFYRVDRGRSRSTGGTGLGLSIVRNVAASHGGTVAVRSQVGVGSVFTVRLPKWSET